MAELPIGEVTFVFTDIEGSTAMLQRLGQDQFKTVLEEHNSLVRNAFSSGVEVRTEGDSFFYAFSTASTALDAALSAQQTLAEHRWPHGGNVSVRIGMHTGQGALGGGDYVGLDVHRAARIAAAGHGGQILLSASTRAEIPESDLRDLGEHRFKDIVAPEHVYQAIGATGIDFPPIRSLDARSNNLPAQPSEFVGRSTEVADLTNLVESARLVTVTGPGGTGKTRLATHVATRLLPTFDHGVLFVGLESIRQHELVMPAVAAALKLDLSETSTPLDAVVTKLRSRNTLVVLDNFEHVVEAASSVADLLSGAPDVHVLVTSQALLRIRGEHAYPVPPLPIHEGIDFFVSRATAIDPTFDPSEEDREIITTLVGHLEGMPLAMELAAARIRLFGLRGLVERVIDHFEFTDNAGDRPERHRTTRSAIDWSYELLGESERFVLRQLGIFDGGFSLDAAEAVAGEAALDGVASLLDKSLLRSAVTRGEARFSMLDSIRRFSLEKLEDAGERSGTADRHAAFYAAFSELTRPLLEGDRQQAWIDRMAAEHDNIRAVYHHSVHIAQPDPGLRTVGAAWRFFQRRGHMLEARAWLTTLLDMPGASPAARVEGLNGQAAMVYWQGDMDQAIELYEQALTLFRSLNQTERTADTLFSLSTACNFSGDLERASAYETEARAAYAEAGVDTALPRVIAAQAFRTWQAGHIDEALPLLTEARDLYRDVGDVADGLQIDMVLAALTAQRGQTEQAIEMSRAVLVRMQETNDVPGTIMVLGLIGSVLAPDDPEQAVRIGAAAVALRDTYGGAIRPSDFGFPLAEEIADGLIDRELFDVAVSKGRTMDLERAVEYSLTAVDARLATRTA